MVIIIGSELTKRYYGQINVEYFRTRMYNLFIIFVTIN